jgi:hypothetical protein
MGILTGAKVKRVICEDVEEMTYNLHVDNYNNFPVNNGLIVHNSIKSHMYALESLSRAKGKPSVLTGVMSTGKKEILEVRKAERKQVREILKAQRKERREERRKNKK